MASAKPVAENKKIESKPVVENKAPADAPGKSRKFLILICAVALVILAGGTSFFVLPAFKGARAALFKKSASTEQKKEVVKGTMALEPFLVNLADTDEVRFVKTTFQLGLAEEMKEGEGKGSVAVPAIRDAIISLLSSKRAEQILTSEGKETLRKEIRARVNTISPTLKVLEVYIVDFVVQL
jgi:flagellar protein FliL